MFETAIRYVPASDDGTETILFGGVLTLLSWLLLPAVFVAGYLQRVLVRTNAGDPAPAFDDWGDLFGEGLRAVAVALAYLAVPAALVAAVLASLIITSVEVTVVDSVADPATVADPVTSTQPGIAGVLVVLGGLALALVATLVAWYVLPAALARAALAGRLGAAFEFRRLAAVATTESYAVGWLVAFAVLAVGGALAGGLASVPVVGWALAPFAAFYLNTVAFALYGQGYRGATRSEAGEPVDGDREVAA